MALTPKQEKFAQEVASGKNISDAYREAYDARRMKTASINVGASQLMADPKIALRVKELRLPAVEKAQVTLEGHLRDLMMLRNMALKAGQISAAISAEVARGKAAGILIDRAEVTGKNGAPLNPVSPVPGSVSVEDYKAALREVMDEF